MKPISSILVANRGEIAVRIIRTVQAGGRRAIAVYSDADAGAPHVALADEAFRIGPPTAAESYLSIEAIIDAAQRSGADAIHPGYGFLSENAAFATACDDAGLVFIGPDPATIGLMGNKAAAKRHMQQAGVPCVPGYEGDEQDNAALSAAAQEIGFPVMVKAAAGGGGRGMRLVQNADDLAAALSMARAEADAAFGSPQLILERAISDARHVEVQVMADQHGAVLHLGERDCSVQRRHQKIIEEAPCTVVDEALRERMGEAAVRAAAGVNYRGAGTVEFLLDGDSNFYFLEMNTRLQVEHPVTELVTGLDLVAMQIDVAEGRPLALGQADVQLKGHAIEARLYAEDPAQSFLPQTGQIVDWRPPPQSLARTDAGICNGNEVSPYYDPMLAKIIARGADRDEARRKLIRALGETALLGLTSNREFLIAALATPAFADGQATTQFVATHMAAPVVTERDTVMHAVAAVIWLRGEQQASLSAAHDVCPALADWSSDGSLHSRFEWHDDQGAHALGIRPLGDDRYRAGSDIEISVLEDTNDSATMLVGGRKQQFHFARGADGRLYVSGECSSAAYTLASADIARADDQADGNVYAPMHGKLTTLHVGVGDTVASGQQLAVIEAMKMQHEITATRAGRITAVHVSVDTQVASDTLLMELEIESP